MCPSPDSGDVMTTSPWLSVIIPTLNEANYLGPTLASLRISGAGCRWGVDAEVLVSDCGSLDGTVALAQSMGVEVVRETPPASNKAEALNLGARRARGEVYWFLDADTPAPLGFDGRIAEALADSRVVGGAFGFALEGPGWSLRLVEWLNRVRYRIWPRYFGDQGIFVRREAFWEVGGFPDRLMEASHLCLNLRRRRGRLRLISEVPMVTSSRRFLKGGVLRTLARDAGLWARDMIGLSIEAEAARYRQENHRRGHRKCSVESNAGPSPQPPRRPDPSETR